MVIVDSDIWSEAFRKKGENSLTVHALRNLIDEGKVTMIGPIRQEILSGIKEAERYEKIKNALRAFPSHRIEEPIFETAASFFNRCRHRGIQGSHTDYLICACAIEWRASILTKDKDFTRYAKCLPIELHEPDK
jgi:predicted nucleic acid-binding protein